MGRQDLALEHRVLRQFKALPRPPRRLLLALSGGVDSMVLAEIFQKWSRGLKLELAVAHVHHGRADSKRQGEYRTRARAFVRAWAKKNSLPFFTNRSAPNLKSEEDFREFREKKLAAWGGEFGAGAIVFAHHLDDLLETRVIRLIRGSGRQGLTAMSVFHRGKLRPLLGLSRSEIEEYARSRGLNWIEDPSNAEVDVLGNWLRREWLPSLERHRPGALKAFARSLAQVGGGESAHEFDLAPYVGLRREVFAAGPPRRAREVLARYLNSLGLRGYSHTHVEEILKRLCSKHEHQAFDLLGLRFQLSPEFLWASRV